MAYGMRTLVMSLTVFSLVSLSLADSEGETSCESVGCEPGYICVRDQIYCIRAPCPSSFRCRRISDGIEKRGVCPRRSPDFFGACVVYCNGDDSCPGNQKCCGSCPTACTRPYYPNGVKPGTCPNTPSLAFERCGNRCTSDNQCPGPEKCCGDCVKECKSPVRTKRGYCPPRLLGGFRGAWCRSAPTELCTEDYDCEGSQKCCNNGCHSLCTRPLYNADEA